MILRARTTITLLALAVMALSWAGDRPDRVADSNDNPFLQSALLARFDSNNNGKLDLAERRAVRKAHGDIDVPLLPDKVPSYTKHRLPRYLGDEQIRTLDNTPADNPLTDAGAHLGRVLFYDRQLSKNRTIACASCHLQSRGFADPERLSRGFDGGRTRRNAMSLGNLRYTHIRGGKPGFFWDERAATLEDQVLMPIQDEIEMGMTLPALEKRLQKLPYYPPLFQAAFGSPKVTSRRVARAVGSVHAVDGVF